MKATYVEINGEGREIFKDPITDDGTKKSARGLLSVTKNPQREYVLIDQCKWDVEEVGALKVIFEDGKFYNVVDFDTIRQRLKENLSIETK